MTAPPSTGLAHSSSLGRRLGVCAVCFLHAGRTVRVRCLWVWGSSVLVEVVRDAGCGLVEWRRHECKAGRGVATGNGVNGVNGRTSNGRI